MTKKEFQGFDITYKEEEEKQYQELNELLYQKIKSLLCCKNSNTKIHFSYNLSLPNTIEIKTKNKTIEQIINEIIKIYLEKNISLEYLELIPYLITWIQEGTEKFDEYTIRKFYRQKRKTNSSFTQEEKNWLIVFFLSQLMKSQMFLLLKGELVEKKVFEKQINDYLEITFYPEKGINSEEEIVLHMKDYPYGWFDKEKKLHKNTLKDWKQLYYIHPVEFILEQKIGCCVDYARIKAYFLSRLGIPYKNILLRYTDNKKIKYHAQTFFYKNDSWYELRDTYIRMIKSVDEIYRVNYGEEVIDRMEFDLSLENVTMKEIIENWKGNSRKKVYENID